MRLRLWRGQLERKAGSREVEGSNTQSAQKPQVDACVAWKFIRTYLRQNTGDEIEGSRLTYDGSQEGNVRETAVHGLIGGILQKIITCKEDNPRVEF